MKITTLKIILTRQATIRVIRHLMGITMIMIIHIRIGRVTRVIKTKIIRIQLIKMTVTSRRIKTMTNMKIK